MLMRVDNVITEELRHKMDALVPILSLLCLTVMYIFHCHSVEVYVVQYASKGISIGARVYARCSRDETTDHLSLGLVVLSRLKLELVGVLGLPELLVALSHSDEPGLTARRVGVDWRDISTSFIWRHSFGTYSSSTPCCHSPEEEPCHGKLHQRPK